MKSSVSGRLTEAALEAPLVKAVAVHCGGWYWATVFQSSLFFSTDSLDVESEWVGPAGLWAPASSCFCLLSGWTAVVCKPFYMGSDLGPDACTASISPPYPSSVPKFIFSYNINIPWRKHLLELGIKPEDLHIVGKLCHWAISLTCICLGIYFET